MTAEASFSVQDVLDNSIYYFQSVHESIEPTSDAFSFYVSDGFSRSEVQSVNITVQVPPAPLRLSLLYADTRQILHVSHVFRLFWENVLTYNVHI